MASISKSEVNGLVKLVQSNSLLNRQLTSICQLVGLPSSGVKATLQGRIVNRIQEAVNQNDTSLFDQIRGSIQTVHPHGNWAPAAKPSYSSPSQAMPAAVSKMPPYDYTNGYQYGGASNTFRQPPLNAQQSLSFKNSPFYEIKSRIGEVRTCDAMSQHRNMVTIPIKLQDNPMLQQCSTDKSMRVMVFCAGDSSGIQDIAFPHQSEIKVNGGEIKANLRGLKNKPGSTRPVDITNSLRWKPPNYPNNVEFIYALTQKKFYFTVYLCRVTPVQDLVRRIDAGQRIPKDSVIREISKKAQDTDIVTTSQVLSLKCPLSYMRLDLPCRSISCSHIQCFDATSYLQLQEQGPQWLCPICNKSAPFDQLAVDEYVKDILANTSKSIDQVTIEPDGKWRVQSSQDDSRAPRGGDTAFDDDFVISEVSFVGGRNLETPSRSLPSIGTTPTTTAMSREGSSMPRGSTSAKRPAAQIIDLTLSSDEDEDDAPIARPPKRQQMSAPNGYSSSGSYF